MKSPIQLPSDFYPSHKHQTHPPVLDRRSQIASYLLEVGNIAQILDGTVHIDIAQTIVHPLIPKAYGV